MFSPDLTTDSILFLSINTGLIIGAYLLGSISSAVLICNILGLDDPRTVGSQNPGATNVMRIGGMFAASLTLVADLLKGIIPMLIAGALELSTSWQVTVLIAAFLGHCLPIFFGFNGGKGVATGFGGLMVLSWQIAVTAFFTWLILFLVTRISSVAGLGAAMMMPFASWYFLPEALQPISVLALLVVWRHHSNIKKLLKGKEASFKKSS
jgi:acyl phosphate:glycerol-3-phosphate acyltransferase